MEQHTKNPAAVELGRLGGRAGRGACKVRKITTEQARKAAMARWGKRNTISDNNKQTTTQ